MWRKCFSRNLYELSDYHEFNYVNGEDWYFSLPIMLKAHSILVDGNNNKYNYRINYDSMTHKFTFETGLMQLQIHNKFYDTLEEITPFQKGLLVENFVSSYISAISYFLKKRIIRYKEFKAISNKEREFLLKYDGRFTIDQLSKKQASIYHFLLKKMYFIIFSLIKIKR